MSTQKIDSADLSLKAVFQDFYRVPDYQREYVWGQVDKKGKKGAEVDQFLADIHGEFQLATNQEAPEYFIGTIVVCPAANAPDILDLIDGQQRITTAFLTLCAIRDFFKERDLEVPGSLMDQISSSTTDWEGKESFRERLDLQYEDSQGILVYYAQGRGQEADRGLSRSIANLGSAYDTIREFIQVDLRDDPREVQRFYGFLINKVKLIRIQTSSVTKALKIFETINDRGLGLDAMDLLKNLLFMTAKEEEFESLKKTWKEMTSILYSIDEKPLRFLRYLIFADYDVEESKLQEDAIYAWFQINAAQTGHQRSPMAFAKHLRDAAYAYANFVNGCGPHGAMDEGVTNTRILGGKAIRQHYILLLAGRRLSQSAFGILSRELEGLMFAYLISGISTNAYERELVEAAKRLRSVLDADIDGFISEFIRPAKAGLRDQFRSRLLALRTWEIRGFRLRYLLAKLTQAVNIWAYGDQAPHTTLTNFFDGNNDIEHILPSTPSAKALEEYGGADDPYLEAQHLGNLVFIERPINQLLGNKPYSEKLAVYGQSQLLWAKCQAAKPVFGVADKITRVANVLPSFSEWNHQEMTRRQIFITDLALRIWGFDAGTPIPT